MVSIPVWCPESVSVPTPGANGCSTSFASIAVLLAAMQTDPQNFSQNGTIYIEQTTGAGFTTPLVLDDSNTSLGSAYSTLNIYNLSIQGGWNPSTGSTSDQTVFTNSYVQVGSLANPWIGSLAINNISVLGSDQDAFQIFASNVALTNLNALYSDQNGISITASEAGTVELNNVNASSNGHMDGSEPVGSGVYVTGGSFNSNARYGIEAVNSPSSTLPIANAWADQEDYTPGSVVTISGNDNSLNGNNIGFIFGESVLVQVQGSNGYTATCQATANSYGGWSCQIVLWANDLAIGHYTYTAVGLTSAVSISGTFSDGNASITGTVRNSSNNPISGALVSCTSGCNGNPPPSTTTAANGTHTLSFQFGNSPMNITLDVTATGYNPSSATLSVNNNQPQYTQNFTLTGMGRQIRLPIRQPLRGHLPIHQPTYPLEDHPPHRPQSQSRLSLLRQPQRLSSR